jgi:surfactin synthase thioesterase subunit
VRHAAERASDYRVPPIPKDIDLLVSYSTSQFPDLLATTVTIIGHKDSHLSVTKIAIFQNPNK